VLINTDEDIVYTTHESDKILDTFIDKLAQGKKLKSESSDLLTDQQKKSIIESLEKGIISYYSQPLAVIGILKIQGLTWQTVLKIALQILMNSMINLKTLHGIDLLIICGQTKSTFGVYPSLLYTVTFRH
jgi:hypothetical protein